MRVLFFAPHAGIWVHSFPEALLADSVRLAGGELTYVTCDGALSSFCITMAARGLRIDSPSDQKSKVCHDCRQNRDWIRRGFDFPGFHFDAALGATDEQRIAELLERVTPESISDFDVDGIAAGRATLYEYLIQTKKAQFVPSAAEWEAFLPRLANTLRSLVAAGHILDREKPERVVMYNTLYSVNAMWRAAADRRGIATYFLHAGSNLKRRLQTLLIGRDSTLKYLSRLVEAWPQHESVPCNEEELAAVTDHFSELFKGTSVFVYSAPSSGSGAGFRERFGIRPEQKILVASMSSYDEYAAARAIGELPSESSLVFATQIEWIHALVEKFKHWPERFLVIRVHPREFPNKREGLKSEHAQMLERELAELPPNVRVNWPADRLSIYDIAEHADVFLNAWSSAGKEMALLGLPVVVYCPELLGYPPSLNYVGATRDSYFEAIEAALRDGWSFERTRRAYRWCAVEYVRAVADIGDGFDFKEARADTLVGRARDVLLAVHGVHQRRDLARRPRLLREQQRLGDLILSGKATLLDVPLRGRRAVDEATETAALRRQIARLMQALYANAAHEPGGLRDRLASVAASPTATSERGADT